MRFVLSRFAAVLPATLLAAGFSAWVPVRAQSFDPAYVAAQQQQMQGLLNNAITAIRQDDPVTACNLRGEAFGILNANFQAFQVMFPNNNWNDLQVSLQDSLNRCQAKGR